MSGAAPKDTAPDAQALHSLRMQPVTAERHLKDGLNTVSMALQVLETWEGQCSDPARPAVLLDQTVAIMRVRSGRGLPSKIDRDPELRSFIRSHIYRLPYADIVRLIAERFPKERRTSESALSRWSAKQRPQDTAPDQTTSPDIV
jgi:hypothetical protein